MYIDSNTDNAVVNRITIRNNNNTVGHQKTTVQPPCERIKNLIFWTWLELHNSANRYYRKTLQYRITR